MISLDLKDLVQETLPILIVDDDKDILKSLVRDLKSVAQIESTSDVEEAVRLVSQNKYSVILSDLQMPKMSGAEFLAVCAVKLPMASRILITAFADLADIFESVNKAKLTSILAKPWEPDELREIVQRALRLNDLERENQELRKLTLTDALTGIANPRYFWERLESEFSRAKRFQRPLSLIMGDVDNFKKVNDTLGHLKGDEVLKNVARSLDLVKRSMDTVARYGGEEFSLILPEASRPKAIEIARRHLDGILQQTGQSLSFGVASYPEDAQSPTELVYVADQALLRAKAAGKNRVFSSAD